MTCFPPKELIPNTLAVLNSRVGKFILSALNPTINYQVGDIERLPIPSEQSERLNELVHQVITLIKQNSAESERTYDFVQPLRRPSDHDVRMAELMQVEEQIDAEVTRLYGLTDKDFEVIDRELAVTVAAAKDEGDQSGTKEDEDSEVDGGGYSPEAWGRAWISYAVGVVLGRFGVGEAEGLGRGELPEKVNEALRALRSSDGLLVSDAGHPDDLCHRAWQALQHMLSPEGAREAVAAGAGGGNPEDSLRAFLDGDFWNWHMRLYRNRPVYWPLETDTRKATCRYRVWVFHEKLTSDTLFRVHRRFADPKIRLLEGKLREQEAAVRTADSRSAARKLEKQKEESEQFLDTLRAFAQAIYDIANGTGDTLTGWEQPKGYQPHIDDGVIINAAPLWPLLPKWKQSNKRVLKETWERLAKTDELDWAGQAMHYWPTRVTETCKKNKSIAIAHGKKL